MKKRLTEKEVQSLRCNVFKLNLTIYWDKTI